MFHRLVSFLATIAISGLSAIGTNFWPQGPWPAYDSGAGGDPDINPHTDAGSLQALTTSISLFPYKEYLLAGGNNGGIWRSEDRGDTWTSTSDHWKTLSIQCFGSDNSSSTILAGTGISSNGNANMVAATVADFINSRGTRSGILFSNDHGLTWNAVTGNSDIGQKTVAGVLSQNFNGTPGVGTIYAATWEPIQPSTRGGYGLFKSTDGGNTFKLAGGGMPSMPCSSLVADPLNKNIMFAASTNPTSFSMTAVYKTTDGVTWTSIFDKNTQVVSGTPPSAYLNDSTTKQKVFKLATGPRMDPEDPNSTSLAVLVIDNANSNSVNKGQIIDAYLSLDSGSTWIDLDLPNNWGENLNPGGQGTENSVIAIDPSFQLLGKNPTLYMAGSYAGNGGTLSIIRASVDPNNNNTVLIDSIAPGGDGSSSPHVDARQMLWMFPEILYISTDGGLSSMPDPANFVNNDTKLWYSNDGISKYGRQNLSLWQCYNVAFDANFRNIVVAGQDTQAAIGTGTFNNKTWKAINLGGDGTIAVINDTSTANTSYYYTSVQWNPLLGGFGRLNRIKVDNNGVGKSVNLSIKGQGTGNFDMWLPQLVLNKNDQSQIAITGFVGTAGVLTTQDTFVSPVLNATSAKGPVGGSYAASYGIPGNTGPLAVGDASGGLWYTADAHRPGHVGSDLTQINNYNQGKNITSIVIDPQLSNQLFLVDFKDLWQVIDAGGLNTVNNLSVNFPAGFIMPLSVECVDNFNVRSLLVGGLTNLPSSPSPIIVADSNGPNTFTDWGWFAKDRVNPPLPGPLSNTFINKLSYNSKSDTLTIGAWGRGVWVVYDLTTMYFIDADRLKFGMADNDSYPDPDQLVDGSGGARPVEKVGTGTLYVTGTALYSGSTSVNEGTMQVDGTLPNTSAVNVASGATLSGIGTIAAPVTIAAGGNLSPGDPGATGTLTLSGNLTLGNTITNVEISPTSASKIEVGGVVTVAGSVKVTQEPGFYPAKGKFQFLYSPNNINGSFNSTVLGGRPGFHFSLSTGDPSWYLLWQRYILNGGLTGNNLTFANYLNESAPDSNADLLLSVLTDYSFDTLKDALETAIPTRNSIATFVSDQRMFSISRIVKSHLSDLHYLYLCPKLCCITEESEAPRYSLGKKNNSASYYLGKKNVPKKVCRCSENEDHNTVWLSTFGDFAYQKEQHRIPNFHRSTAGVIVGYEHAFEANGFIGVITGYAYDHYKEVRNFGKGNINSLILGPYGMYTIYDGYIEAGLYAGFSFVDNKRHIFFPGTDQTTKSSFNLYQLMPHFGFGYDFNVYCDTVLEPFATFDYVANWQEHYKEKESDFAMEIKGHNSSMLRSEIGLSFYQNKQCSWGNILFRETAAYVNIAPFGIGKVTAFLAGMPGSFTVKAFKNQNLFTPGFSIMFKGNNGWFGSISYDGQFGSSYIENEGQIMIGVFF